MRRLYATTFAAILVLSIFIALPAQSKVLAKSGKAWVEKIEGVRVIHLAGTPREMGLQHGTLLKTEIRTLLDHFFKGKKTIFGASFDNLEKASKVLEKQIPAEYIEEMKAIAEASDSPYEQVLYANVFLDVVSAGWMGVKAVGCTNFAALPGASKNGDIIHGRNLDWSADDVLVKSNTVFIYKPTTGMPFAAFSWPGMVGTLTGLNSAKISMGEMTSMSSESTLDGIPIMIQLRMLLQNATNLDEAYAVLANNPRTTGYNVLVTDAKSKSGFIAEQTAKNIVRINPDKNILMHTNHFVTKSLSATQMKYMYMFYAGKKSDTFYRYDRLTELIGNNIGKIDAETAKAFLADRYDPAAKKISGSLENTVLRDNTLQSMVLLPGTGEMYVALKALPAPDGGFVRIVFNPEEKQPD